MDNYIEVIGLADLTESVHEYRADVSVTVRAAQPETALKEVNELRNQCIRHLLENGLSHNELAEGGGEVWRPWFWKKKPGQEASQKILVKCDDIQRLFTALSSLESLFENQRFAIHVSMQSPRFSASNEDKQSAQAAAIANAKSKAIFIAKEAEIRLGSVIQVEELDIRSSRTGMYGDEEWRGFAVAAAGPASGDLSEPLESATRTSTVKYRIRFSIEPA